jgi:hypothetical protein
MQQFLESLTTRTFELLPVIFKAIGSNTGQLNVMICGALNYQKFLTGDYGTESFLERG